MATNDNFEVAPAPLQTIDMWRWTRRLGRLGVVGAVVLGTSVAFGLGGYNGVLAAWLYGLPFSLPLAWHDAFWPALHGSPVAAWGSIHLVLGAATVASWTSIGLTIDAIRRRMRGSAGGAGPSSLPHDHEDRYLEAARLEVERLLGANVPARTGDAPDKPKGLLSSIARLFGVVTATARPLSEPRAV